MQEYRCLLTLEGLQAIAGQCLHRLQELRAGGTLPHIPPLCCEFLPVVLSGQWGQPLTPFPLPTQEPTTKQFAYLSSY